MIPLNEMEIRLAGVLGLRQMEVKAAARLHYTQWKKQLLAGEPLVIHGGTKSGRPRAVDLSPETRRAALAALEAAIASQVAGEAQAGRTVAPKVGKPLLPTKVIHDARRAFARQQLVHHEARGLSREDALAKVGEEMGYGAGRGHCVENLLNSGGPT